MSDINAHDALAARLDDLVAVSRRGELGISPFLSPGEVAFAEKHLTRSGVDFLSFGGHVDVERKKIYILPDYMSDIRDAFLLLDYGYDIRICAVSIKAGGFRGLSHRDYLGSILGLGLERSVIGDIFVWNEGAEALVFCDDMIGAFIVDSLEKVAKDRVRSRITTLTEVSAPKRSVLPINDTVASPRCDCIVAALCSFSREKARETVEAGLVEVDYEREERSDRALSAPCVISVRGKGKFRVISVEDKTRKGRYRLVAEKYL